LSSPRIIYTLYTCVVVVMIELSCSVLVTTGDPAVFYPDRVIDDFIQFLRLVDDHGGIVYFFLARSARTMRNDASKIG
jgi:hypothetical protein